ncbi:MAG: hypothetical protein DMF90_04505 [Acidobacteria bacterium]|nr:MAG: hypothetical protein DMF90_04505 [Acidobacteriota bacterium]
MADQLDRRERRVFLQPLGREWRLRRHSPFTGPVDERSAHSGITRRFLLRRAHRRHRRLRRSGRDHGVDAGRSRLRAHHVRRPRAHREYGPGRLRLARHSGDDLGRPARTDARQRHPDDHSCALGDDRSPAAVLSLLIPAYLVVLFAGWRRMWEIWPAVLTAGASFAVGQFTVSNFVGPELTDALSALISLGAVAALLQVWRPREVYLDGAAASAGRDAQDTPGRVTRAYATYGILIATVLVGQIGNFAGMARLRPPANVTALLRCGQGGNQLCPEPWVGPSAASSPQGLRFPVWEFNWPGAYRMVNGKPAPIVQREAPVVATSSPYALTFRLDFLAAAGTLVLVAALIAFVPMMMRGVAPGVLGETAGKTFRQLRLPVVTIAFILSIATVMNYSGMTSSMALALATTGGLFPFFAAWLGMIGVFLTGSDTSSNTLFGPLQATTAKLSGFSPILMGATNSSAGVMGKMISPQNLSVGAAGVGAVGREGEILARVAVHSLVLTTLMGVLAMLQAYVVPWMVPTL